MRLLIKNILLFFCISSTNTFAISLGTLNSSKDLNSPLSASIELLGAEIHPLNTLHIAIGDADQYKKSGLVRENFLSDIRLQLLEEPNGSKQIRLTSSFSVREPIIYLIVELSWPGGKQIREYNLLFDPPNFANSDYPAIKYSLKKSSTHYKETALIPDKKTNDINSNKPEKIINAKPSQSLWSIAKSIHVKNTTIYQTLISIQNKNPTSFRYKNINGLIPGARLILPTEDEIRAVPPQQAADEVAKQKLAWEQRS